ncbi:MAG TPA: glycoside hydrolase family 5 protein [Ktedonobacterales bacterium]|jgi:endoglucanase
MDERSRVLSLFITIMLLLSLIITGTLVVSLSRTKCTPLGDEYGLRAVQGRLIDANCREVHLTGVNWFGMETSAFAPHGLDVRNWQDMLDQIVRAGFNTIRFPFSNQFLEASSMPQGIDYQKNPDLRGLHGLSLLDRLVQGASQRGLKVILDRHRPTAYAQSDLWYTSQVPESRWIADWVMLARHFLGNPTVIGADLHNEPHGAATWGSGDPRTDWRLAAERAGNAILSVNPAWLIIVQGVEQYKGDYYWWGGNLEGAGQFPVHLLEPEKLVYSIHDYGPEVSYQSWFSARNFPQNLPGVWMKYWGYLQVEGVAPVFVGEFGAISVTDSSAGLWMRSLIAFMKHNGFSYTYWAWNPDTWDTGGLLLDDWQTLDPAKMESLATYQCPLLGRTLAPLHFQVRTVSHCSGIP